MSGKLTAVLCTAALLGAGIYGGAYLGDRMSNEIVEVATTSNGTSIGQAPTPQATPMSADRSPSTGAAGQTSTEIYNRIIAERQTDEVLAARDFLDSGVLPDISDGKRFDSLAAHHAETAKVEDKRNFADNQWLTWDVAAPGMALQVTRSSGGSSACTLGFVGERDGNHYGITAGHCMQGSGTEVQWKKAQTTALTPFGSFITGQVRDGSMTDNAPFSTDFAITSIDGSVPGDMAIAKRYTVVDVVEAGDITPGMEICKLGYRTEETCGPVLAANGSMVRVNLFSLSGDSGSPAYVKLGEDKVAAVGLLSGSPEVGGVVQDSLTDFSLIEPVLRHTGLTLTPYL